VSHQTSASVIKRHNFDRLSFSLPLNVDGHSRKNYLPIRGRMRLGEQVEPAPYGRYFSHCTGGVFTLSEVVEKATGMRTDHYAQQKLFAPLGITNVQWVLKVAQLYLDGGSCRGVRIVNESWVRSSTRRTHALTRPPSTDTSGGSNRLSMARRPIQRSSCPEMAATRS
jgi:CubicO group peptidase (beta-lactamase class C family)